MEVLPTDSTPTSKHLLLSALQSAKGFDLGSFSMDAHSLKDISGYFYNGFLVEEQEGLQPKRGTKRSKGQYNTRKAATIETRTASLSAVEQESIVPTRSSFARMNKPTLSSLCSLDLE